MASTTAPTATPNSPIDRQDLVQRHNPILKAIDPMSPLSVGNGEFAFTADVTGLQSFPDLYLKSTPLCTMSQWGWHSNPPAGRRLRRQIRLTEYDAHGRTVRCTATSHTDQEGGVPLTTSAKIRTGFIWGRSAFRFIRGTGGWQPMPTLNRFIRNWTCGPARWRANLLLMARRRW